MKIYPNDGGISYNFDVDSQWYWSPYTEGLIEPYVYGLQKVLLGFNENRTQFLFTFSNRRVER